MVSDTIFTGTDTSNHNHLGGLQGGTVDEYYHLTNAEHTVVGNTSGTNTGDQDISGIAINAGDIDDIEAKTDFITVTQAVDLDTMESDIATNNDKVTNATHTGEVEGSGALTIADNVVDEANLKLDEGPTNDYVLTADSTKSGGMKWAASSGGFSDPMTTRGDIIVRDATNTTARLGIGTNGQALMSDGTDITWQTPAGSGNVSTSGTPVDNDFAKFVNGTDIEGRSYSEVRSDLGLVIGTDVQAHSAVLDATTASFLTADETKLDGIEALADVTDTANVTSAGALMKTGGTMTGNLSLPNTGLHIDDTDGTHSLVIAPLSDLTMQRTLGISTGDSDRTITLTGDTTLSGTNTGDQVGSDFALGDLTGTLDDISNGTTYVKSHNDYTDADQTKVGHISVTQAVDLDTIESDTATNNDKISFDSTSSTKLGTIEESADVTDAENIASSIVGVAGKTTPVDADTLPLIDSAAANVLKKLTWANLKATIKSYYDSVTATLTNKTLTTPTINQINSTDHLVLNPATNKLVKTAVLRQDDTSNSYKENVVILTGWGQITGADSDLVNETVTFGITFSEVPIVLMTFVAGATTASSPDSLDDFTARGQVTTSADTITTSNFRATLRHQTANFNSTYSYAYTWMAIGQLT